MNAEKIEATIDITSARPHNELKFLITFAMPTSVCLISFKFGDSPLPDIALPVVSLMIPLMLLPILKELKYKIAKSTEMISQKITLILFKNIHRPVRRFYGMLPVRTAGRGERLIRETDF